MSGEFRGTPGQWKYRGPLGEIYTEEHGVIADLMVSGYEDENGNLMAAAPMLLIALQQMVSRIEYYARLKETEQPNIEDWAYTYNSSDMDNARAAIAQALGEQQ